MKPLMVDNSSPQIPMGNATGSGSGGGYLREKFAQNPEFWLQAGKFLFCFCGLQASYLTWGYMQELVRNDNIFLAILLLVFFLSFFIILHVVLFTNLQILFVTDEITSFFPFEKKMIDHDYSV